MVVSFFSGTAASALNFTQLQKYLVENKVPLQVKAGANLPIQITADPLVRHVSDRLVASPSGGIAAQSKGTGPDAAIFHFKVTKGYPEQVLLHRLRDMPRQMRAANHEWAPYVQTAKDLQRFEKTFNMLGQEVTVHMLRPPREAVIAGKKAIWERAFVSWSYRGPDGHNWVLMIGLPGHYYLMDSPLDSAHYLQAAAAIFEPATAGGPALVSSAPASPVQSVGLSTSQAPIQAGAESETREVEANSTVNEDR